MSQLPSRDLLDATHTFPGRFMFKAIGQSDEDFVSRVVAVVRITLQQDFDPPYEVRTTNGRRHVAVTIEPWVESAQQVIDIYAGMRQLKGLVMLL